MEQEPAVEETHWLGSEGQTAWVWAEAVGGDRSVDGGGGGGVCVGVGEMVVYVSAEEGMEEGEAAGRPWRGCCGPPEKIVRG